MNDPHGLTAENMLRVLPEVLKGDNSTLSLSKVTASILAEDKDKLQRLIIYACIDDLPEDLLDILAYDFKVDWWDPNYTLEEKRRTLKESWHVHRTMGTKAAVVKAISAIYPETRVLEWWEYDGKPYHFRLLIDSTYEGVDPEKHRRVLERVDFYKALRSVLDAIEYEVRPSGRAVVNVGTRPGCVHMQISTEVNVDGLV